MKLPIMRNIKDEPIQVCSLDPLTGFYRDGYCRTGKKDLGTHTVCAKMTKQFLEYTKSKGNNLYSVVKPGDNWCLCEYRWNQAYNKNLAPPVIHNATNMRTDSNITNNIFSHSRNKYGGNTTFLYSQKGKTMNIFDDANPNDTIKIKYKSIKLLKKTINNLEKLYKKKLYTHKRISQVAMIIRVRLNIIKKRFPNANNIDKRIELANKYVFFLKKRTKKKGKSRYSMIFK